MRSKLIASAVGVAAIALAILDACGSLSLVGTAPEARDGGSDADEAGLGPACGPLPCLGDLPQRGWSPLALPSAGACARGFKLSAGLFTNPRLLAGGCACGACQTVGQFSCAGATAVSGGDNCNDAPIASAQPNACTRASAQHLRGKPPNATGAIGCTSPNDAGAGAAGDAFAVCVPDCETDFCAAAGQCVAHDGEVDCPAGFSLAARAGTGVDPRCEPCPCDAGPPTGACVGTITAFETNDCSDAGQVTSYAVGTCNVFGSGNYGSVRVNLVPPPGSCTPTTTTPSAGDAGLVAPKTICCR